MMENFTLSNGVSIPAVGYGTYLADCDSAAVVENALRAGYRHFDTASFYGNEAELGRARSKKAKANGPRTIDLDLLWMDGETHGGKKLPLPHPLIGERDFVLVPLEDLMHDPARFFRYNGVEVKEPEDRVGHIVGELGRM